MIKRDGHYILTVEDWNTIIKYFTLSPRTVAIKEAPDLLFTEYCIYDIYSKKTLFSFYNHDGKIRIPGKSNEFEYEIDISTILTKNPDAPSQKILNAIKTNAHNSRATTVQKFKDKIVEKTVGHNPSSNNKK